MAKLQGVYNEIKIVNSVVIVGESAILKPNISEDKPQSEDSKEPENKEEADSSLTEEEKLQKKVNEYESLVGGLKAHELVAETIRKLNISNIKLRRRIEELVYYKEEYAEVMKMNQELSEEVNSLKGSAVWDANKMSTIMKIGKETKSVIISEANKKEKTKKKVIEEMKDYLKEIIYIYKALENFSKERISCLIEKQNRITEYGNMIEELKKLPKKDSQLKPRELARQLCFGCGLVIICMVW